MNVVIKKILIINIINFLEHYRSDEFDYTKFALRSKTDDLEGIASMNRIYMNMKYLTSKMDD